MSPQLGDRPPMPPKRSSTAASSREPSGDSEPGEAVPQTRAPAARPAPALRSSRGAAVIPPPRKSELGLHRLVSAPRPPPTREQIAARAYELWLQSGCRAGKDAENWLQAERELLAGCGSAQQG